MAVGLGEVPPGPLCVADAPGGIPAGSGGLRWARAGQLALLPAPQADRPRSRGRMEALQTRARVLLLSSPWDRGSAALPAPGTDRREEGCAAAPPSAQGADPLAPAALAQPGQTFSRGHKAAFVLSSTALLGAHRCSHSSAPCSLGAPSPGALAQRRLARVRLVMPAPPTPPQRQAGAPLALDPCAGGRSSWGPPQCWLGLWACHRGSEAPAWIGTGKVS